MKNTQELSDALNKIKVYRPQHVIFIMYDNNFKFIYDYFNREHKNNNIIYSEGGTSNIHIKYRCDNIDFDFHENKDGGLIFLKLYTPKDTKECIVIIIDPETKLCAIQGITNYLECVKDNLTQGGIGTVLLKCSLKYLSENKEKYGIKRVMLTDNSYFTCLDAESIKLSRMHFLLNGNTWYGKYGFRPYDPIKNKMSKEDNIEYEKNQEIIKRIKLRDVPYLKQMIIDAYNFLKPKNLHLENILYIYDKMQSKNELLSNFLKVFLKRYNKTCGLFSNFYEELYKKMGMYDFYKKSFCLDL